MTGTATPSEGAAMTDRQGIPARELSDEELERQGVHAHTMRHWGFLHGTAEQLRTHTQRMLELEQEDLPRPPRRPGRARAARPASSPATSGCATWCRPSPA